MAVAFDMYTTASLFVGNLSKDVHEEHLFEIFSVVGPIDSIEVARDKVSDKSLGYAYVTFSSAQDAERALETLNYYPLKGRSMSLMWKWKQSDSFVLDKEIIFVKNLHSDVGSIDLLDMFAEFGKILDCRVAVDEAGKSQGFGFVRFQTREDAEKAVRKTNGHYFAFTPHQLAVIAPPLGLNPVTHYVPLEKKHDDEIASILQLPYSSTATALTNSAPEEQKHMLGKHLYFLIRHLSRVDLITAMLLESCGIAELMLLIDSPPALDEKIKLLQNEYPLTTMMSYTSGRDPTVTPGKKGYSKEGLSTGTTIALPSHVTCVLRALQPLYDLQ